MINFQVLDSVERVVSKSRSVFFNAEGIGPAISNWEHLAPISSSWDHPCHFFDGTEETIRWIFTLDILNHCFWPDQGEPVWTVNYLGEDYSGYWGLAASLKRAKEQGFPLTDSHFLAGISAEDLSEIFSGQGRIPMFDERLENLREAGMVIQGELGGDVMCLFAPSGGSAVQLVMKVVSLFPSFRDEVLYMGNPVYFWKRAQIFAADVSLAFDAKKWGKFHDADSLTAFADYKLPQVLRELGIISYRPELAAIVDSLQYLSPGSEQEVEIRAMTIWAVEQLKKGFKEQGRELTAPQIDSWLWRLGQEDTFRKRPYHRCRTIFY